MNSVGIIAFFPILLLFLIIMAIPIIIGVYVYRDANKRGMNAPLWVLVSMLAPSCIGFIIYLVVRGNYSDLQCPQCDTSISEQFSVCPKCGARFKGFCENCKFPTEPAWTVCPKCASPLPETQNFIQPIRRQDKSLGKILIAILIIPVLLVLFFILGMLLFRSTSDATLFNSSISTNVPLNYFENQAYADEIFEWIRECDSKDGDFFVLSNIKNRENDVSTQYLIYSKNGYETEYRGSENFNTIDMQYYTKQKSEPMISIFASSSNSKTNLKIFLDGKEVDYEIKRVDFEFLLTNIPVASN